MRDILKYPLIEKQKLNRIKELIINITDNPDNNDSRELNELNRITGREYAAAYFFEYWGWTDLDTLAEKVLTPAPPCVRDLCREELKEIITIIKNTIISPDDIKAEYYMELLHKSLPLSNVQKYIKLNEDADEIADNMLSASSRSVIVL